MIKIGFIDYYINEWHANNYPIWIAQACDILKLDMKVEYVYAKKDSHNDVTTAQWCEKFNVKQLASIEEVVDKSDCIIVLSPDNQEMHIELSEYALKSGKPVYIDKTFASSLKEAKDMFALGKKHNTPLYSSSALRFSEEIDAFRLENKNVKSVVAIGPGHFAVYGVHLFEIVATVMKTGATRIICSTENKIQSFTIEYEGDRCAQVLVMQNDCVPYQAYIENEDGVNHFLMQSNFFLKFMQEMLKFFNTGIPPVPCEQTIEIMAIIDGAKKAQQNINQWIAIEK